MNPPYDGGCHCGRLRYRISLAPTNSGYCHCSICRRTTGAPVLAWATVPIEGFEMTKGEASVYASSDLGSRLFCGNCGAQILYRYAKDPSAVEVNLGSLDEPDAITPRCHIYDADRISWLETADDLPRHAGGGSEPDA